MIKEFQNHIRAYLCTPGGVLLVTYKFMFEWKAIPVGSVIDGVVSELPPTTVLYVEVLLQNVRTPCRSCNIHQSCLIVR